MMESSATRKRWRYEGFRHLYSNDHYSRFEQEHRDGGSFGLRLMHVDQGSKNIVDPPLPELAFCTYAVQPDERIAELPRGSIHYGDGWRDHEFHPHFMDIHPADRDCSFRLPPMQVQFMAVRQREVSRLLEEAGVDPAKLDEFTNRFEIVPRAVQLAQRIWAVSHENDPSNDLMIDGMFMQMLAELLRKSGEKRLLEPVPALGNTRMARVVDYVEAHIEDPLTVSELAEVACLSAFHFSRSFKAETGATPHRYVMSRRVERAKAMLLDTRLDLTSIALSTGFASHSHLNAAFKSKTGASPGQWREQND